MLLDAVTGIRKLVLPGNITSLTSSLDGTLLVFGDKETVNLWDVQTGGVIKTFGCDISASISPDGTTITLGTGDGAIRLWDIQTVNTRSIETHDSGVTFITFSPSTLDVFYRYRSTELRGSFDGMNSHSTSDRALRSRDDILPSQHAAGRFHSCL